LARNNQKPVYSSIVIRHRLAMDCVGARMRNFYQVGLIALAFSMAVSAVNAQTPRNTSGPAELPPSSFDGAQFVDGKGCIFVRAGFDGNVTWVPRVTRDRKLMCGFPPTFVARSSDQKQAVVSAVKAASTRTILPKSESVVAATVVPAVPKIPNGYSPAWDDDRLNANRAKGTATGEAQMAAIWTTTVPRRLIADQK
jgi:hypothetical protein